jgi:hypothetical protein
VYLSDRGTIARECVYCTRPTATAISSIFPPRGNIRPSQLPPAEACALSTAQGDLQFAGRVKKDTKRLQGGKNWNKVLEDETRAHSFMRHPPSYDLRGGSEQSAKICFLLAWPLSTHKHKHDRPARSYTYLILGSLAFWWAWLASSCASWAACATEKIREPPEMCRVAIAISCKCTNCVVRVRTCLCMCVRMCVYVCVCVLCKLASPTHASHNWVRQG